MARILKGAVSEVKDMTYDEIMAAIDGEPEVGSVPVNPGMKPQHIQELKNEDKVPNEGVVYYDIRFKLKIQGENPIEIIINLESQNDYYPGYSIVRRGLYYCARLLSSQLGTEFAGSDYDNIKKVYSIWICVDVPVNMRDTIKLYSVKPSDIYGTYEPKPDFDLLNLVIIGLGKEINENNVLLGILETILSEEISGREKETKLLDEYRLTKDYGEGVREMCNISGGFYDRGMAAGMAAGRAEGIAAGRAEGITEGQKAIIDMLVASGISREEIRQRTGI